MDRSNRTAFRALVNLASGQSGYFTARQAWVAGQFQHSHLGYHCSVGNIERVELGLYRLVGIQRGENDELVRYSLWSRDRCGFPQAVVSHESALAVHQLFRGVPSRVHLTVPPRFRKRRPVNVSLHSGRLLASAIESRSGFQVTTPLRSLVDAAASDIGDEPLNYAVQLALLRDLVRPVQLLEAAQRHRRCDRLRKIARWRSRSRQ